MSQCCSASRREELLFWRAIFVRICEKDSGIYNRGTLTRLAARLSFNRVLVLQKRV